MPRVRDVLSVLESFAPTAFALPGDKIGLQVGDIDLEVKRAHVSLDHSVGAVHACLTEHSQLLLCHHPLIFSPLANVNTGEPVQNRVQELVVNGIAYIAAHTNWDCAPGGVNDALAHELGLVDVTPFGTASTYEALKLVVMCPSEAVEAIMDAASEARAGTFGNYRRCGFYVSGDGTFEALEGASPAVGTVGARNTVLEVRLEMEVSMSRRAAVEAAVRAAHPYEEPPIDFFVPTKHGHPISRKGRLRQPLGVSKFRDFVDKVLGFRSTVWEGSAEMIEWVGVCGGAAGDEWPYALAAGCQALVTGEVKQNHAVDAVEQGLTMCAAGHYATEQPGVIALAAALKERLPSIEWNVYTPAPGQNGRPL